MNERVRITIEYLCGVFIVSLSIKYLHEIFGLGCVRYYKSWIYPVLDFGFLLFVGLFLVLNTYYKIIKENQYNNSKD